MKSTIHLVDEARERKGEQHARIGAYSKYVGAYFRDSADADDTNSVRGMYADGRPALQMISSLEEALDARKGAPKLIKAMVDDIVSVRGVVPNLHVLAEDASPTAEALSDKRTRALRQWWKYSRMVLKQPRAAWSMATKGDVCYLLNPRFPDEAKEANDPFKPAGVYIDVVPVDVCFPRFKVGDDADQLDDLYIVTKISRHAAREFYGVRSDDEEVEVIIYYDDEWKRTIVGGVEVIPAGQDEPIKHDLGFVPAEWHANKPTDGRNAQADINDCVELELTMQRQFHIFGDAIMWATYPTAFARGKFASETLQYGPGSLNQGLDANSMFELIAPQANVGAAQMIFESTKSAIMEQAGVSPMRIQGGSDKSNVTGRAVAAQMSPQEARLAAASERLAGTLIMLNSKMMLMYANLKGFANSTMVLDAVPKDGVTRYGGAGKDSCTPEDFGGWIANNVSWDSLLHLNAHERLAMGLQLMKEGLFSGRRVLEYIGEEDPERTLAEAEADQKKKMAMMAAMQGGGQPPPGGAPPGGPPQAAQGPTQQGSPQPPGGDPTQAAQAGMSLAGGGDGGAPGGGGPPDAGGAPVQPGGDTGALKPISGFSPLAAPPGSPAGSPGPIDNPLPKVDAALAGVKLHGEVVQRFPIPGGIRVMLSDHRDIAPVKAALSAALPDLKLDVRAVSTKGARGPSSNGSRSN